MGRCLDKWTHCHSLYGSYQTRCTGTIDPLRPPVVEAWGTIATQRSLNSRHVRRTQECNTDGNFKGARPNRSRTKAVCPWRQEQKTDTSGWMRRATKSVFRASEAMKPSIKGLRWFNSKPQKYGYRRLKPNCNALRWYCTEAPTLPVWFKLPEKLTMAFKPLARTNFAYCTHFMQVSACRK